MKVQITHFSLVPVFRRALVLSAVFASALLVGCSENDEPANSSATVSPDTSSATKVVKVFTWEEYFSPDAIASFEEETGIAVDFHYYENMAEMKARIEASPDAFDVVVSDGASIADMIGVRLLKEVDAEQVPNLTNLDGKYLDLDSDPGNTFSLPYMWGTTLISYRSDLLPNPERSWKMLFDPEVAKKVVMLEERDDLYALTLLALGYDLNSENPAEIEEATELLVRQARDLNVRYDDIIDARELIQADDAASWAFVAYSGDAALIAEEDEKGRISYFIPEEGAPLWVDSFCIPREAQNDAAAHVFIDYMSRAEVAAENSNYLWYATANKAAKPFLNAELVSDETIYPSDEVLDKCHFIAPFSTEKNRLTNRGMKLVFDSLSKGSRMVKSPAVDSAE